MTEKNTFKIEKIAGMDVLYDADNESWKVSSGDVKVVVSRIKIEEDVENGSSILEIEWESENEDADSEESAELAKRFTRMILGTIEEIALKEIKEEERTRNAIIEEVTGNDS